MKRQIQRRCLFSAFACSLMLVCAFLVPLAAQVSAGGGAEESVAKAVTLLRRRDFPGAERVLRAAASRYPETPDVRLYLGVVLLQQGKTAEAEKVLSVAVRLAPNEPAAHYNRALALLQLKKNEEAKAELREVLRLDPDFVDARYNLAILLEGDADYANALRHFETVYQLQPQRVDAGLHILSLLFRAGDREKALSMVAAIGRLCTTANLKTTLARILVEAKEYDQAIVLLEAARNLDRANGGVRLLAEAYLGAGHADKAIRLLESSGGSPSTRDLLIRCLTEKAREYVRQHNFKEASSTLRKAESHGADSALFYFLRGFLKFQTAAAEKALSDFNKAISADSSWTVPLEYAGHCYFKIGRYSEALLLYERAIKLSSGSARACYYAGLALEKTGHLADAIDRLRRALKTQPENAPTHFALGRVLSESNQFEVSIQELLEAVRINPGLEQAYAWLAKAYRRSNDFAEAHKWSKKLQSVRAARVTAEAIGQTGMTAASEFVPWEEETNQ